MRTPSDRVFFHYSSFNNTPPRSTTGRSATTGWTTLSTYDSGKRNLAVVTISDLATAPTRAIRVAASVRELAAMLQEDGVGARFDGVFVIADVRHTVAPAAAPTGQQLAPSQTRVILLAASVSPRLPARASAEARKLQDGLIAAGFARASFVEIDRQGSVRR
jgi:hypothetical protein